MKDGVNGLLVPIKDEEALADGICRLIEIRIWRNSSAERREISVRLLTAKRFLSNGRII